MNLKQTMAVVLGCLIVMIGVLVLNLQITARTIPLSELIHDPVFMLVSLIGFIAVGFASIMGCALYHYRSTSCQNWSCRFHPRYEQQDDEAGYLNNLIPSQLDRELNLVDDADYLFWTEEKLSQDCLEAAEPLSENLLWFSQGFLDGLENGDEGVLKTEIANTRSETRIDEVYFDISCVDEDELSEIEEPKSAMEFTDNMIQQVLEKLLLQQTEAALKVDKEKSGQRAAIEWLTTASLNDRGKHFRSTDSSVTSEEQGILEFSTERISDYMRGVLKHARTEANKLMRKVS